MDNPDPSDAWKHTLDLLLSMQLSRPACDVDKDAHRLCRHAQLTAVGNRRTRAGRDRVIHLHIIEKYSSSAIAICWRDATSGCYGEQLWKVVTARSGSTCALSGLRIRRGDAVFRPWARGYKPVNGDSMILASAVERTIRYEDCALLER